MYGWFPPRNSESRLSSTFGRGGHDPGGRLVSVLVVASVVLLASWAVSLPGVAGSPPNGVSTLPTAERSCERP